MAGLMSVLAPAAALGALTLTSGSSSVAAAPATTVASASVPAPPDPSPPPTPVAVAVPVPAPAAAAPPVASEVTKAASGGPDAAGGQAAAPARGLESTVRTSLRGLPSAAAEAGGTESVPARTLRINALIPARKRLLGE